MGGRQSRVSGGVPGMAGANSRSEVGVASIPQPAVANPNRTLASNRAAPEAERSVKVENLAAEFVKAAMAAAADAEQEIAFEKRRQAQLRRRQRRHQRMLSGRLVPSSSSGSIADSVNQSSTSGASGCTARSSGTESSWSRAQSFRNLPNSSIHTPASASSIYVWEEGQGEERSVSFSPIASEGNKDLASVRKASSEASSLDAIRDELGSLELVPTSFTAADLQLPEIQLTGGSQPFPDDLQWTLALSSLRGSARRILLREMLDSDVPYLRGRISPLHRVTLSGEQRQEAGILPQAEWFAWSYAALGAKDLRGASQQTHSADLEFLTCGGFVYFDRHFVIRDVRAAVPCKDGGLNFSAPQLWLPEWTRGVHEDRFQPVQQPSLVALGAQRVCWICPEEPLYGVHGGDGIAGRSCPHGGFVYVFQRPSEASSNEVLHVYIPVLGCNAPSAAGATEANPALEPPAVRRLRDLDECC